MSSMGCKLPGALRFAILPSATAMGSFLSRLRLGVV